MTNPAPRTIENDERAIEQLRFQQQCFLSMYWDTFAQANQGHTYDQFVQIGGNGANSFVSPNEVVEKLTSVPNMSALMKAPPLVISSLMPQVRLFKVSDGIAGDAKEFLFEDHLSTERVSAMTSSAAGRGQGVSLVSFEWTKNGRDPGEANSSIQVKMKLLFSSMMDLTDELDSGLKWMDLIAPSPGRTQPDTGTAPYKIRAVVGYTDPPPSMFETFGIRSEEWTRMSSAVKHAKISLYLNIVKHELTLLDGGGIELSLEYFAALEGILSDPRADVLLLGMDADQRDATATTGVDATTTAQDTKQRELRERLSSERCERDRAEEGSEERERRQESMDDITGNLDRLEEAREREKGNRYSQLLSLIETSGRVFKIKVKAEDLGRLNGEQLQERDAQRSRSRTAAMRTNILNQLESSEGTTGALGDLQRATAQPEGDNREERDRARSDTTSEVRSEITSDPGDSNELEISFMYYGDLLNVALKVLKPAANGGLGADPKKELKPVVGPYTWTDMMDGTQKAINLADVPISLENFKVWFLDTIVGTQRTTYPLKAFIRDTITSLVSNSLTPRCFGMDQGTQTMPKIGINIFDAPMAMNGENPSDRIKPGCADSTCFGNKRLALSDIVDYPSIPPEGGHRMASYLMIFCSSTTSRRLTGNEEEDDKMGRYWMRMGATGGLVKEIKFKAQDQEGTREMRIERMGRAGYLHEIYNADLKLFGCPVFSPGCMIYIDPSSVGIGVPTTVRALAQHLGMGGYYMILEATTVIENGNFETSLKTVFEAPGSGEPNVTVDPDANPCNQPARNGETPSTAGTPPPVSGGPS